ncbi:MAG TPA: M56 family metallopeptidase [Jatrophihabitantaceae bacterium]
MIVLAATPLIVGVLAGLLGGRLGQRLQPRHAVPLLTALALTVALCTAIALSGLAVLALAQLGPMPRLGHWSAPALRADAGEPVALGLIALGALVLTLGAACARALTSIYALARAARQARRLVPVAGNLVLVDDAEPVAYAVAGRIVMSRSLLVALPTDERRAVLAHEAAHLRHRHHLYLHLTALSAAASPLLRPLVGAIAVGIERWADEDAAGAVRSREVAARGLARAALAQGRAPGLAVADSAVAERVRALLEPTPVHRLPAALALAAGLACWLAAAAVTWRTEELIQIAERALLRR